MLSFVRIVRSSTQTRETISAKTPMTGVTMMCTVQVHPAGELCFQKDGEVARGEFQESGISFAIHGLHRYSQQPMMQVMRTEEETHQEPCVSRYV